LLLNRVKKRGARYILDISQEIGVKKEADFNGLLDSLLSVIKKEVEV